jgi:hypothetical protein
VQGSEQLLRNVINTELVYCVSQQICLSRFSTPHSVYTGNDKLYASFPVICSPNYGPISRKFLTVTVITACNFLFSMTADTLVADRKILKCYVSILRSKVTVFWDVALYSLTPMFRRNLLPASSRSFHHDILYGSFSASILGLEGLRKPQSLDVPFFIGVRIGCLINRI